MPNYHHRDINTLYTAMQASIKRIGVIQSNMSNVNTVGYKGVNPDSAMFSDVLQDMFRDESRGALMDTRRNLDLAITDENAFFLVEGVDGPERTRDGRFQINAEGKMVNIEGKEVVVLDRDYDVDLFGNENFKINEKGEIFVNDEFAGRVVIDYQNRTPGQNAHVLQGKLESSNVDLTENIIKIMQTKRHVDTIQNLMSMEMVADKSLVETYGRNV